LGFRACGEEGCAGRCVGSERRPGRYPDDMALPRAKTAEEVIERMRHAGPPTPDDVTILWDGRRLDSREAVMEWLAEVDAKRAEDARAHPEA
jgi:hypothetical protein